MPEEINNSSVGTPEIPVETVEAPDTTGQVETEQADVTEQAEIETDKPDVEFKNFKELQAEFTKRSQKLAEIEKQRAKETEELNAFRQFYAQEQIKQKQMQQQPVEKSAKDFAEMSEMEKFNYLVDQRVNENVKPYIDKIGSLENYIQYMQQQEATRTWNSFVEKNPDAANYGQQLAELITKHNMDLERAYKLIKADSAPVEAKQEILKEIQVKQNAAKLQMPVPKTSTTSNDTPVSFEEAFERAQKLIGAK